MEIQLTKTLSAPDDPALAPSLVFTLNAISCGFCKEVLVSWIYQCRNHHLVCSRCRYTERRWCSCPGSVESFRNETLERLVGCFSTDCPNSYYGCTETIPIQQHQAHEAECRFYPRSCPCCGFVGAASQFASHFIDRHGWSTIEVSDYGVYFSLLLDTNQDRITPIRVASSGAMFLIHLEQYESSCRIYPSQVARQDFRGVTTVTIAVVKEAEAEVTLKCSTKDMVMARDGPFLYVPRCMVLPDGCIRVESCIKRVAS